MLSGSSSKTNNYKLTYFWPTLGDARDFAYASQVGQWVSSNARVLDKRRPPDVAKLLAEQFPDVEEIDAISFNGPMARYRA
jgi:hypothetical protein